MSARRLGRALLLDLDGTLLDTARDMGAALEALCREEGRAAPTFEAIRPQVSHGGAALVRLGFPGVEASEFERLRRRFLDLYRPRLAVHTRLFPGFAEVLATLKDVRVPVGVVTNKPGWLTSPILDALGLSADLACVVAGDTLPERKPHPAPLLHAARLAGLDAASCIYAGDAERDIIAGRAAGMQTVAVRFGYLAPGEDPAAWRPDGIAERPADLLDWIDGLPRAHRARAWCRSFQAKAAPCSRRSRRSMRNGPSRCGRGSSTASRTPSSAGGGVSWPGSARACLRTR